MQRERGGGVGIWKQWIDGWVYSDPRRMFQCYLLMGVLLFLDCCIKDENGVACQVVIHAAPFLPERDGTR